MHTFANKSKHSFLRLNTSNVNILKKEHYPVYDVIRNFHGVHMFEFSKFYIELLVYLLLCRMNFQKDQDNIICLVLAISTRNLAWMFEIQEKPASK